MNKPILMPQLSATRARTGLRSIGELIALLIKQYELQDQLRARQQAATAAQRCPVDQPLTRRPTGRAVPSGPALGRAIALPEPGRPDPASSHPQSDPALNKEALNKEALNREALNREALNREALNREALNREALNREALNKETTVEFRTSRTAQAGAQAVQATFAWFDAATTESVGA